MPDELAPSAVAGHLVLEPVSRFADLQPAAQFGQTARLQHAVASFMMS